ncbi:MAG: tetrahydromethanopterin S-methyltransferase subunit A [Candidatus Nezhaarchaeota archaeon]|nr:tetrahydromethanopterin S-methyltransferase subunit A [Candidatus Nezhaarchaeota archaeon]MCX8141479.1 tetrahydromethanopterin S-methyltransferase subunit A [Candidatus Nezhaarchaeota archaeon]MDW8049745.1 tetrahydromethanopterin S-methyltransferase subunit A [Nitrososphaerota archaeon]
MSTPKKVEPAPGWPIASGDYVLGDPKGCVAICTLASEGIYPNLAKIPGVAIAGPCKTENIGLEKIVVNIISNPNIRFLIVCGIEVTGHVTGACFKALYEKGVDPATKKIINAPGAIPYVEHLTTESIQRFQKQVQFIDMIGVEDVEKIKAKVEELVAQDPGAYPEPPFILELEKRGVEEVAGLRLPLAPTVQPLLSTISSLLEDIKYRVQLIGREKRLTIATGVTRAWGIIAGAALAISLLGLIALMILSRGG